MTPSWTLSLYIYIYWTPWVFEKKMKYINKAKFRAYFKYWWTIRWFGKWNKSLEGKFILSRWKTDVEQDSPCILWDKNEWSSFSTLNCQFLLFHLKMLQSCCEIEDLVKKEKFWIGKTFMKDVKLTVCSD